MSWYLFFKFENENIKKFVLSQNTSDKYSTIKMTKIDEDSFMEVAEYLSKKKNIIHKGIIYPDRVCDFHSLFGVSPGTCLAGWKLSKNGFPRKT